MPAVSPTVWLPGVDRRAPVVPPLPTSAPAFAVEPSICRSNLPGSVGRVQVLDDLDRAGVAGVGDRADDVCVGVDRHVGRLAPVPEATAVCPACTRSSV